MSQGSQPTIFAGTGHRFAFPLLPRSVRALVPPRCVGAYMMLRAGRPLYVGRSDTCVQTRLAAHSLVGVATHFVWEPCTNAIAAFSLESFWFHRISDQDGVLNLSHPASPRQTAMVCPFRSIGDSAALAHALAGR